MINEIIHKYIDEGLDDWDKESIEKFSKTIGKTPDEKGFFDVCVQRMKDKNGFDEEKAQGFCAKIRDKYKGHPMWRGKGKSKEKGDEQGKEWRDKFGEIT